MVIPRPCRIAPAATLKGTAAESGWAKPTIRWTSGRLRSSRAKSSKSSRLLPIPGAPETSTICDRERAMHSSTAASSAASSGPRPTVSISRPRISRGRSQMPPARSPLTSCAGACGFSNGVV